MADLVSKPFTVKVKWVPTQSEPKNPFGIVSIKEQSRSYIVEVDSKNNANMTVYDTTGGGKTAVFNSEFDGDKKYTQLPSALLKTYPEQVQKSILDVVGKEAEKQRTAVIKEKLGNSSTPLSEQFKYLPGFNNTAASNEQSDATKARNISIQITGIDPLTTAFESNGFKNSQNLSYPLNFDKNSTQDFIEFKVIEYQPRIFTTEGLQRLKRYGSEDKKKITRSTIRLPIQGGIMDSNIVNWGAEPLDAIQQAASFVSLTAQNEDPTAIIGEFSNLIQNKNINPAVQAFIQAEMSKMAISSNNNFFSRAFGAILNPNMELLFQNVELRPFSFRFDLTPREEAEAIVVKKIIRVFKQSMAPRQGVADIFLKTPMVYDIRYINGKRKGRPEHTSLNKIKTCALKNFAVNYTPSNQYMTYDDDEATMSAYSLDMQFQELEPVYFDDYNHDEFKDDKTNVSIGY
jgi:hypothetical protein